MIPFISQYTMYSKDIPSKINYVDRQQSLIFISVRLGALASVRRDSCVSRCYSNASSSRYKRNCVI